MKMQFKINTGADVTIIPEYVFNQAFGGNTPKQENSKKVISDSGCVPLDVIGVSHVILQKESKHIMEQVYIMKKLYTSLLGRPAITKLELVSCKNSTDINTRRKLYPVVKSTGLGQVQQPYTIKLKPNAQPFSFKTPRHVPYPLLDKIKKELLCMENIGVISYVEEATEWCAGIVVVV